MKVLCDNQKTVYFKAFKITSSADKNPAYLERNSDRIRKANNDTQLKFTFAPLPSSWMC